MKATLMIKKKNIDYYTEGISFLIVRRGVLLKLKPFEATRQILMSALCGSVCVLAYYLLIIEICIMETFFYTINVLVKIHQ